MSENVLVIPATFMVGKEFPANLPLTDGSMKPIAECSADEVRQAVEEVRAVARGSRERLRQAYDEHVQDLEVLAQLSAYAHKYAEWTGVRSGDATPELLWTLNHDDSDREPATPERHGE